MTDEELSDALVRAIRLVADPDTPIDATTPLDETTLDSVGLLEALVYLEDTTPVPLSEDVVRQIALEPDYDPSMRVADLAALVGRLLRLEQVEGPVP